MTRNQKKSSNKKSKTKGKSSQDWVTAESDAIRARLPQEGEVLGVVLQILGAGFLLVKCTDGFTRQVRIPGKYRKRLWCRVGDIVIVMPLFGMNPDEKGELVHRFKKNEANWLVENGYLPEEFLT